MPPRTKTVTATAGPPPALSVRIWSRARSSVAKGPSVLLAFGSVSLPDQESFPLVATKNSFATVAERGPNDRIDRRAQKLYVNSRRKILGMSGS